jgi:hypothetical protein
MYWFEEQEELERYTGSQSDLENYTWTEVESSQDEEYDEDCYQ